MFQRQDRIAKERENYNNEDKKEDLLVDITNVNESNQEQEDFKSISKKTERKKEENEENEANTPTKLIGGYKLLQYLQY